MTTKAEVLAHEIKSRLEAIRATSILASEAARDPATEGTFHAVRILVESTLDVADLLNKELKQ